MIRGSHDSSRRASEHAERVKRLAVIALAAVACIAAPVGGAAAASPTVRIAIVHTVSGCHVWHTGTTMRGPAAKVRLDLGALRMYAGTTRTVVFRKPGVYRLTAKNVQSSEQQGLQTLGADNSLTLTVVVR